MSRAQGAGVTGDEWRVMRVRLVTGHSPLVTARPARRTRPPGGGGTLLNGHRPLGGDEFRKRERLAAGLCFHGPNLRWEPRRHQMVKS